MLVLSNLTAQTIQPGQAVTFDKRVLQTGNCECWNSQIPNRANLRANGGVYSLGFSGNISSATAATPVQLSIAIEGQPLIETTMISTPETANVFNNVSTETRFRRSCCALNSVSVINSGTNPVTLDANSAFVIDRRG